MCGIFGYTGKRTDAAALVLSGLKTLEYRGYDSWGVAAINQKNKILVKKRVGKIGNSTVEELLPSSTALGHTRWATHGGVTQVNAHPHLDCDATIALIHNGIIENYDDLKKELEKKNHRFLSETDTEVAVHLIEERYKELQNAGKPASPDVFMEAVRMSFLQLEGCNAIIALDAASGSFVAAKNGSPLAIAQGKDENLLASDAHALIPYSRDVYFMEDNDIALITAGAISLYEAATGKKKTVSFQQLQWQDAQIADKKQYSHFMLKEIFDQKTVLLDGVRKNYTGIDTVADLIRSSYGTYFIGCGTAAYACLAGTYFFSKIAGRHVNFSVGSEFGYLLDFLTPKSLIMALSQSGETIDILEPLKKAKEKGVAVAALVNVFGSTLHRLADYPIELAAGTEKAVVSTKAFTAKLAHLLLLAYTVAGKKDEAMRLLETTNDAIKDTVSDESLARIKQVAKYCAAKEHAYSIGRGVSYPVALEIALKIKESSYVHAEGFAAGELKHGVIALIEEGTPCIAVLPSDETYPATLAGCLEMKARGGKIIGIATKQHPAFDYFLPIADCGIASCIPAAITGQLLGYFIAIEKGLDPDMPRNLAKSVTVK